MLEQILDVTDNLAVVVGIAAVLATPFWFAAGLIEMGRDVRFRRRQRRLDVDAVESGWDDPDAGGLWSEGVESGLRRRGEA
jgi:hypothetical protein